jgi:hypothetical protein
MSFIRGNVLKFHRVTSIPKYTNFNCKQRTSVGILRRTCERRFTENQYYNDACVLIHYVRACVLRFSSGRGVRRSERRKCVMAEEFYWRSKICMYECKWKISFNDGVLSVILLKMLFIKQDVYHFDFLNLIMYLIFLFSEMSLTCTKE